MTTTTTETTAAPPRRSQLDYLKLGYFAEQDEALAQEAAEKRWTHLGYLERLIEGEYLRRQARAVERRVQAAHFPKIKLVEDFDWSWPTINELKIKHLFRLGFIATKTNVVSLGPAGAGKTHLASAIAYHAYHAYQRGHSVLFTTAIDIVNHLIDAQAAHRLKPELKKYLSPALVVIDELGFLPLDKAGADLLFQVISHRYESGSLIITTNKAFKSWPETFNNDATIASALLDRLLHRSEAVVIKGRSYRM
ncbi:MAG: ATP-binding protein [Opitutus sp.]|nr:ATP-binding protein [Opitutus sp.]